MKEFLKPLHVMFLIMNWTTLHAIWSSSNSTELDLRDICPKNHKLFTCVDFIHQLCREKNKLLPRFLHDCWQISTLQVGRIHVIQIWQHLTAIPEKLSSRLILKIIVVTKSLEPLRGSTSRWRPLGPFDFVLRALGDSDFLWQRSSRRRSRNCVCRRILVVRWCWCC